MPGSLTDRLKQTRWLYRPLLRFGLTSLGRRLRERANQLGYQLIFRGDRIVLRQGARDVRFRLDHAIWLWMVMPQMEYLQTRFIYRTIDGREIADYDPSCPQEQKYRLPETTDEVWLPQPPEPANFIRGYLAQGRPTEGDVVFDCGAYCGEMSIVFSRLVGPRGRVFAFEPDPVSRHWLQRNIEAAKVNNVTLIDRGLWKETTELAFVSGLDVGSHFSDGPVADSGAGTRLPVIGFADACALAGAVPNFVKMDIEGAEVETIEGAHDFIGRQRIRFAIASYHPREGEKTSAFIEPLLRRAGYEVNTGFPEHLTTWAWKN